MLSQGAHHRRSDGTDGGSTVERHLFVAGCPRSGTSALAFLMNEHPRLALGFERYKRVRAQLDPFHFTPTQFFAPVLAETDIRGDLLYARLRRRWERGTVTVIGDKVPLYTRVLPQLLERFPRGRIVVMVREPVAVASSFASRAADPRDWWPAENDHRLAVQMWNEALAAAREAEQRGEGERIFLLPYEPLLAGDERWLEALLAFAGLYPTERLRAEQRRLADQWHARSGRDARAEERELVAYVDEHRDGELLAWVRERIACQLGAAPAPAPLVAGAPTGEELPLTEQELGERAAEQRELLEQMRRPGERGPEEMETLERRLLQGMDELTRRGERLRRLARAPQGELAGADWASAATLACAPPALRRGARVTFIVPHQRQTTGGVYVIEQFARHLAAMGLAVTLAVRGDEPLREIPGVEVRRAARLTAGALPTGDVVVYPADMRDAHALRDLPDAAGRRVLFFQGYGTPGSAVVEANLAAAETCVAIAHWLVDVALRRGAPCAYVPQGLDRAVFHPGPAPAERAPRVSVMSHRLDWKGLEDALAAVALVRRARPEIEVVLFGSEPAANSSKTDGTDEYLASPTRPEVAALLRSSAVHIVASWEEGYGLTGAEAIACGAALATTDTKGSRDYALDGATALVSAPRDPEALAYNTLRLLEDIELRERIVATGQRQLRTVMPSWPEAARRMALALLE
jgi:glycosyltransferase involved in cell wall biosynthesis